LDQLRKVAEGIDHRGAEVGTQDHVGLVDRFPAGDRRTVEHDAFDQCVFVDGVDVHRQVLPLAARVGEAVVDVDDVLLFDHLEDGFCVRHGCSFRFFLNSD
jgi:hypothetical protein